MSLKQRILTAAKASAIPEGSAGRWTISRVRLSEPYFLKRKGGDIGETLPPGSYTNLWCLTDATMHTPPGDCVMNDMPGELNKHLQFMLKAHGDVLITGLGLGCVARGCLANPKVKTVTIVEL